MDKFKVILSHPTGNQNVRAVLDGLFDHHLLDTFITTLSISNKNLFLKKFNLLNRRAYNSKIQYKTKTYPTLELLRQLSILCNWKQFLKHEKGIFSIDAIYTDIDKKTSKYLSKNGADAIYSFDDTCSITFKTAKKLGIKTIYDLPTGYWRANIQYMQIEKERFPDWINTLPSIKDSEEKLNRKDEEITNADLVIVASSFTEKTLDFFPRKIEKTIKIPYGFPVVNTEKKTKNTNYARLKILFVGKLSHQKGLGYLFDAINDYDKFIDLTLVGSKVTDDCKILDYHLSKHAWVPYMLHADLMVYMRDFDLLVFPSLFDGFGLVVTEAMAQGLPVIASDRSCGPDVISSGEDGWIIEAAQVDTLKNTFEEILTKKHNLYEMSIAARTKAQTRTWQDYGDEVALNLIDFLDSKS